MMMMITVMRHEHIPCVSQSPTSSMCAGDQLWCLGWHRCRHRGRSSVEPQRPNCRPEGLGLKVPEPGCVHLQPWWLRWRRRRNWMASGSGGGWQLGRTSQSTMPALRWRCWCGAAPRRAGLSWMPAAAAAGRWLRRHSDRCLLQGMPWVHSGGGFPAADTCFCQRVCKPSGGPTVCWRRACLPMLHALLHEWQASIAPASSGGSTPAPVVATPISASLPSHNLCLLSSYFHRGWLMRPQRCRKPSRDSCRRLTRPWTTNGKQQSVWSAARLSEGHNALQLDIYNLSCCMVHPSSRFAASILLKLQSITMSAVS